MCALTRVSAPGGVHLIINGVEVWGISKIYSVLAIPCCRLSLDGGN